MSVIRVALAGAGAFGIKHLEALQKIEGTQVVSAPDRTSRRAAMRSPAPSGEPTLQLTFFGQPDPVLEALKLLDVEALSPLEALTKLFELQRLARGNA